VNHLVIGGFIPFAIGLAWRIGRRRGGLGFVIAWPLVTWLCMIFAVAPDLPRLFGATDLYNHLALDPRCDIFFWHYSIDKTERPTLLYPAAFAAILAAQLFTVWLELRLSEKER